MPTDSYFSGLTPARLEAFSDGVLAVVITIMVLELKVPHESGLAGLHAVLPSLLTFALSFAFIGIYGVNHHLLVHRLESVDARILYSNLVFLFCASLLPFFTSWVLEKERDALYTLSLIAVAGSFMLLRLAIERRLRLNDQRTAYDAAGQRKHWLSLPLYLLALPTASFSPTAAMGLDAVVTLVWILPDLGTRDRLHAVHHPVSPQDQSQ